MQTIEKGLVETLAAVCPSYAYDKTTANVVLNQWGTYMCMKRESEKNLQKFYKNQ